MNLLKILIPSWRFFDRAGDLSQLYFKAHTGNGNYGFWQEVLIPPKRHLGNFVLNPQGNLYLASQALVERLVQEISEDDQGVMTPEFIEHQSAFKLVKNLVEVSLKERNSSFQRFQFMIKVIPASGAAQRLGL